MYDRQPGHDLPASTAVDGASGQPETEESVESTESTDSTESTANTESTGDERVDTALSRLDDLPGVDLDQHAKTYTAVHDSLRAILDATPGDTAESGASSPPATRQH